MRRIGMVFAVLAGCTVATDDKGSESGTPTTPTTEDGACASTGEGVPQDVRDAIATTCGHFVTCGVDTCASCVESFEASYFNLTPMIQDYFADSTLCFSTISCEELLVEDLSDCVSTTSGSGSY